MQTNLPISDMSLSAKVIEHVALTDTMLHKAAEQEKQAAATKSAVDKAIPGVVDALVQHSRIGANEREKVAQLLRDPVATLRLMQKLAGHRNADELGRLGTPTGDMKTASARRANDPRVGVRTGEIDESTKALFAGLGLAVPTA